MELDSAWHNAPLEQKTYSGQLKLNYETVRHYVADIERGMQKIETSGTLSKTDLTDFKKAIHNNFVIQKKSLDWCKLPPSAKPVYDNPNIAILESNAKVHEENIAQAQKLLDEMQTPAQIQEIITKEHEELEQLKTAKKKDTKRIKALEDHAVQLGIAYGQAYSAEQRYKTDNLRQHGKTECDSRADSAIQRLDRFKIQRGVPEKTRGHHDMD